MNTPEQASQSNEIEASLHQGEAASFHDLVNPQGQTVPSDDAGLRPALENIVKKTGDIGNRLEDLYQLFEARLQSDDVQAKALERLHDQLQDYKSNFIRQALLPVLKDLIFCIDFVTDEIERMREKTDCQSALLAAAKSFEHVKHMLTDALFKYDVEPYRCEDEFFDRKTQQCLRIVPTNFEADDKKIAVRGVIGYREQETILRKEQVTVYKYVPGGA
jgi:molecular chaperone GrpE (heat shock protein)